MTHDEGNFILRGWHVFAAFVAFFGVILVANIALVTTAARSFPGEEASKAYARGLDYNAVLKAERAEAALGWRVENVISREGGIVRIQLEISDPYGEPLRELGVSGRLKHPAAHRADVELEFAQIGRAVFEARAEIDPGAWILEFDAETAAGARIDRRERLFIE
ncbi:MAG: FixH family protein [Pseudomonadota bacterium]